GLLEEGQSGPVLIGPTGSADMMRLENFLRRNGHPHRALDSGSDGCAQTLLKRFSIQPEYLPIVLCPGGEILRNPTEGELARCRRLDIANLSDFEGTCVHYWASATETKLCAGQEVVLTGAGNSAGQAVVFLADHVKKLWMIVRGKSLEATMSQYLIDRIRGLS